MPNPSAVPSKDSIILEVPALLENPTQSTADDPYDNHDGLIHQDANADDGSFILSTNQHNTFFIMYFLLWCLLTLMRGKTCSSKIYGHEAR